MTRKLGFTGMDQATESELREAFKAAGGNGAGWELVAGVDADYVVVDMDSMYGPMSWIRLHGEGREVIGLTGAARSHADHHLARPIDAQSLLSLLSAISSNAHIGRTGHVVVQDPMGTETEPAASPAMEDLASSQSPDGSSPPPAPVDVSSPDSMSSTTTPAPAPADLLAEEQPLPADEEASAPPEAASVLEPAPANAISQQEPAAASGPESVDRLTPDTPTDPVGPRSGIRELDPSAPTSQAPAALRRHGEAVTLAAWLAAGTAPGRWVYRGGEVAVFVDTAADEYFGPSQLKPLTPLFAEATPRDAPESLADDAWRAAIAGAGAAQPLSRLKWLGGLLSGHGQLLPGNDPAARYRLLKWPQTEREFPRHFRIAMVMMKAPATLTEIAQASGTTEAETADFINASLASGHAEAVADTPDPALEAAAARGGLFGRLRKR